MSQSSIPQSPGVTAGVTAGAGVGLGSPGSHPAGLSQANTQPYPAVASGSPQGAGGYTMGLQQASPDLSATLSQGSGVFAGDSDAIPGDWSQL